MNTKHKHNHIIMNSVNFETGMKFHQSAKEMRMVKEFNNELCRKYGLSITETKADPFKIPKWKDDLKAAIRQAMECSNTREEFIAEMAGMGYGVKWSRTEVHHLHHTGQHPVPRQQAVRPGSAPWQHGTVLRHGRSSVSGTAQGCN